MDFLTPRYVSDAEFAAPCFLNTTDYEAVKDNVYQLQIWTHDETSLKGLNLKQLLALHDKLEKEMLLELEDEN